MPLNGETVTLDTKEGDINGELLLPNGGKTYPVVLLIAGSGPTDMDGNSAIGNMKQLIKVSCRRTGCQWNRFTAL